MFRNVLDYSAAYAALVMLVGVACGVGIELLHQPVTSNDAIALQFIEKSVLVLTAVVAVYLLLRSHSSHVAQLQLLRSLLHTHAKSAQWRARVMGIMATLSDAIDRQFARWDLTPAERELALLLLKGFDCSDIALLQDCSERAIRTQAQLIYRKARLSGRVAFAGFFLDDLRLTRFAPRS